MSKGTKYFINCNTNGEFTFDEGVRGQHRLLYLSFTKILNSYPEYLFVYTTEDSKKSVIGNNSFVATFFIKDNTIDDNIYTYINTDNYEQIVQFTNNTKNVTWQVYDINNTRYQINDLKLIIEKK